MPKIYQPFTKSYSKGNRKKRESLRVLIDVLTLNREKLLANDVNVKIQVQNIPEL